MNEKRMKKAYNCYIHRARKSPLNLDILSYDEFKKTRINGPKDNSGRFLHEWQRIGVKPEGFMYRGEKGKKLLEKRFENSLKIVNKKNVKSFELKKATDQIEKYHNYAKKWKFKKLEKKIKTGLTTAKKQLKKRMKEQEI